MNILYTELCESLIYSFVIMSNFRPAQIFLSIPSGTHTVSY